MDLVETLILLGGQVKSLSTRDLSLEFPMKMKLIISKMTMDMTYLCLLG